MRSSPSLHLPWALALITAPLGVHAQQQFQQFFPGWSDLISSILKDNCTAPLQMYQDNPGAQGKWRVIDCVLGIFTESRKAELAAAAVTLGLTPTILQRISASSAETSILFLRRPFLALLIAASSITPGNPESSRYANPADAMRQPVDMTTRPWILARTDPIIVGLVSLAEYVLAGLAAGNVALLAYQLGFWSFFASANYVYDPTLLTYAALLIHFAGVLELLLRVKVTRDCRPGKSGWRNIGWTWLALWVRREGVPAGYGEPLLLNPARPSILSLVVSWIQSIAPTLQVMFGTISLSGSLLMSQVDARNCVFRYLFSAVVARAVLSYELWGMREVSHSRYTSELQETQTAVGHHQGEREQDEAVG